MSAPPKFQRLAGNHLLQKWNAESQQNSKTRKILTSPKPWNVAEIWIQQDLGTLVLHMPWSDWERRATTQTWSSLSIQENDMSVKQVWKQKAMPGENQVHKTDGKTQIGGSAESFCGNLKEGGQPKFSWTEQGGLNANLKMRMMQWKHASSGQK